MCLFYTIKYTHTHTNTHAYTHTWAQMLLAADRHNVLLLLTDNNGKSCLWTAAKHGHGSVVEVGPGGRRERGTTACDGSDGTQHMLQRLSAACCNTPCNTPCNKNCNKNCNILQHTLKRAKISHETTHTHAFCLSVRIQYIHFHQSVGIYTYKRCIYICMFVFCTEI